MTPAEKNYIVSELECLAVIWSIKRLRALYATIIHASLRWLKNVQDPTERLARWVLTMQQWDFTIVHRKGTLHSVPDALSRMYEEKVEYADAFLEDVIRQDSWYMLCCIC